MGDHSCAASAQGQLYCWGANQHSQAAGLPANSNTPLDTGLSAVTKLPSSGSSAEHSCVVAAGDTVYCWGKNHKGQAGTAAGTDVEDPAAVTGI